MSGMAITLISVQRLACLYMNPLAATGSYDSAGIETIRSHRQRRLVLLPYKAKTDRMKYCTLVHTNTADIAADRNGLTAVC